MSSGIELRTEEANGSIRNRWEEKYIPFPPFVRSKVLHIVRACSAGNGGNETKNGRID